MDVLLIHRFRSRSYKQIFSINLHVMLVFNHSDWLSQIFNQRECFHTFLFIASTSRYLYGKLLGLEIPVKRCLNISLDKCIHCIIKSVNHSTLVKTSCYNIDKSLKLRRNEKLKFCPWLLLFIYVYRQSYHLFCRWSRLS